MKNTIFFALIILLATQKTVYSQNKSFNSAAGTVKGDIVNGNKTENTKNTVNIYQNVNGDKNIVIGHLTIDRSLKSNIILTSIETFSIEKNYETIISTKIDGGSAAFDVDILLEFDKTVEDVKMEYAGSAIFSRKTLSDDKKYYIVKSSQITAIDGIIKFKIISKYPVVTTIYGISQAK